MHFLASSASASLLRPSSCIEAIATSELIRDCARRRGTNTDRSTITNTASTTHIRNPSFRCFHLPLLLLLLLTILILATFTTHTLAQQLGPNLLSGKVGPCVLQWWAQNNQTQAVCWVSSNAIGLRTGITFIRPPIGSTFVQLAGASTQFCGLTNNGSIHCNSNGVLSNNYTSDITNPYSYVATQDGIDVACALMRDGTPWCWHIRTGITNPLPVVPLAGSTWKWDRVEVTKYYICASVIQSNYRVICFAPATPDTIIDLVFPTTISQTVLGPVTQILCNHPAYIYLLFENGLVWSAHPTFKGDDILPTDQKYRQVAMQYTSTKIEHSCGLTFAGVVVCQTGGGIVSILPAPLGKTVVGLGVGDLMTCLLVRPTRVGFQATLSLPGQGEVVCSGSKSPSMPVMALFFDREMSCLTMPDYSLLQATIDPTTGAKLYKQISPGFTTPYRYTSLTAYANGCCGLINYPATEIHCYDPLSNTGIGGPLAGGTNGSMVPMLPSTNGTFVISSFSAGGNDLCVLYSNGGLMCTTTPSPIPSSVFSKQITTPSPTNLFQTVHINPAGRICAIERTTKTSYCAGSVKDLNAAMVNQSVVTINTTLPDGQWYEVKFPSPMTKLNTKQVILTYDPEVPNPYMMHLSLAGNVTLTPLVLTRASAGSNVTLPNTTYQFTGSTTAFPVATIAQILDVQEYGQCFLNSAGQIGCVRIDDGTSGALVRDLTWIAPQQAVAFSAFTYSQSLSAICGQTSFYLQCFSLRTLAPIVSDVPVQVTGLAVQGTYSFGSVTKPCALGRYSVDDGALTSTCGGLCAAGRYGSTTKVFNDQCTAICPLQNYCPARSSAPIPCPSGSFGNELGLQTSACSSSCPKGFYCPQGSSQFIPCTAGYFGYTTGLSTPTCSGGCNAGYVCASGSTSPTQAKCGNRAFYCPMNSSEPSIVGPGYVGDAPDLFGDTKTFTTRRECTAGYECNGGGLEVPCDVGSSALNGSSFCSPCSPGRYQNRTAQETCLPCPAGLYSSGGAIQCTQCEVGKYSKVESGAQYCSDCSAGTASNSSGLYDPKGCPACKAGEYADHSGAILCSACAGGKYSPSESTVQCLECTDGLINAAHTICTKSQCPTNSELTKDANGDPICAPCELGKSSQSGGRCETCSVNSYTPASGSGCVSCLGEGMSGLECSGGLASVKQGYWAYEDMSRNGDLDSSNTNNASLLLYRTAVCPLELCPETRSLQVLNDTTGILSNSLQTQCPEHRLQSATNLLCAECEDGFMEWYGRCLRCDVIRAGSVIAIIFVSFLFTLFLLYTSKGRSAGVSSILLYFLQTSQLEVGDTSSYLSWIRVINFSFTNINTGSCVGPMTSYEQTTFALLTPLFLLMEMCVIMLIHWLMTRCVKYDENDLVLQEDYEMQSPSNGTQKSQQHHTHVSISAAPSAVTAGHGVSASHDFNLDLTAPSSSGSGASPSPSSPSSANGGNSSPTSPRRPPGFCQRWLPAFSIDRYIGGCFATLLFTYTQVGSACLNFLHCVSVGSLGRVVFAQPTMHCDSSSYTQFSGFVILVLLVYIIIFPLSMLLWLGHGHQWRLLRIQTPVEPSLMSPLEQQQRKAYQTRYAPLLAPYHETAWYWSLLILLRRIIFVTVNTFLVLEPSVRACLFVLLNFVAYIAQVMIAPYKTPQLNHADQISHICLVFISALLTMYPRAPFPTFLQVLFFLLIVPLAVILALQMLRQWLKEFKPRQFIQKRRQASKGAMGKNGADRMNEKDIEMTVAPVILTTPVMKAPVSPMLKHSVPRHFTSDSVSHGGVLVSTADLTNNQMHHHQHQDSMLEYTDFNAPTTVSPSAFPPQLPSSPSQAGSPPPLSSRNSGGFGGPPSRPRANEQPLVPVTEAHQAEL